MEPDLWRSCLFSVVFVTGVHVYAIPEDRRLMGRGGSCLNGRVDVTSMCMHNSTHVKLVLEVSWGTIASCRCTRVLLPGHWVCMWMVTATFVAVIAGWVVH
jgi:hypothetical protein